MAINKNKKRKETKHQCYFTKYTVMVCTHNICLVHIQSKSHTQNEHAKGNKNYVLIVSKKYENSDASIRKNKKKIELFSCFFTSHILSLVLLYFITNRTKYTKYILLLFFFLDIICVYYRIFTNQIQII